MPDEIIFKPKGHRYIVNGTEVPSVSEIIRFISIEVYGEIGKATLDIAADRGTRTHKATADLDTKKTASVTDDILPYVEAYRSFLLAFSPSWLMVEQSVNRDLEYAGTIDRYGFIGSELALVDIKTSSISKKKQVLYGAQLNLYRMALQSKGVPVNNLYILQLKKDGTYKLIQVDVNDEVANACLLLHKSLTNKKKKKG